MKIIYGPKGTGKTKAIIDSANKALEEAKGYIVFVTDTNRYAFDLKYQIRFIDVTQYAVQGMEGLRGFLKGIVAANGDNEYIFLDGIARITGKPLAELENIFANIEMLEKQFGVNFIVTCSAAKEDLPEFVLKHVN